MKFTSEDLLKFMGLEVGNTICVDNSMNYFITKRDDILFENLRSHSITGIENIIEYIINYDYEIIQPKPILTEDEKVILRNLPKEYEYIAREEDNELCIFENRPMKRNKDLFCSLRSINIEEFNHLFQFIKWEDEPYLIEELLKE